MPKIAGLHKLTVREVMNLGPGAYADGGNLTIRVKDDGRATATFRYTSPSGARREAGLGIVYRDNPKATGESLTAVRGKAAKLRDMLAAGADPVTTRRDERDRKREKERAEKLRRRVTLIEVSRDYCDRVIDNKKLSTRHKLEWLRSIERCLPKWFLDTPVDRIDGPMLFSVLAPLQQRVPETAGRVRQRLQKILADCEFRGLVKGNVAGAIRDKLHDEAGDRERTNYRALDYRDVPGFMTALREHQGVAHRLLEFTILCACRTNESRMMVWSEIDLTTGVWLIPGVRMKAKRPHTITLPPRALEIVLSMKAMQKELELDGEFVFPSLMKKGSALILLCH